MLIDDEMLDVFAVVCSPNDLPEKLAERYAGLVDRLALYVPFIPGERDEEWSELLAGVRAQLSSN